MEESHFENGRGKSPYDPKLLTASLLVGRCHITNSMRCAFTVNNLPVFCFSFLLSAPTLGICFMQFISRLKQFWFPFNTVDPNVLRCKPRFRCRKSCFIPLWYLDSAECFSFSRLGGGILITQFTGWPHWWSHKHSWEISESKNK